jgi:hypothetical protein
MRLSPGDPSARTRTLLLVLCLLTFRAATTAQTDAPPDAAEQERILKVMREYAASYRLPDMTYDQKLNWFRRESGPETWRKTWSHEGQRIAHDGREYACCRLGKHRKPMPNQWVQTWYIPGFGTFPWDGSNASVVWNRWDVVRGHRVVVFDYSVRAQDSHAILPYRHGKASIPRADGHLWSGPVTDMRDSAILPYTGSVWVDPSTGAIWRHSTLTTEFPARFMLHSSSVTNDYDLVTLGTTQYMLNVMTVDVTENYADTNRYEWVFRNHRKFAADSTITFFGADSAITYRH